MTIVILKSNRKCQPSMWSKLAAANGLRNAYIEKYVANPATEANIVKAAGEALVSQEADFCGMSAPVRSRNNAIKPPADDAAMTRCGTVARGPTRRALNCDARRQGLGRRGCGERGCGCGERRGDATDVHLAQGVRDGGHGLAQGIGTDRGDAA